MSVDMLKGLQKALVDIRRAGLYKHERPISTAQGATIGVEGSQVINLCANNYLGFANHPHIVEAAKQALDRWGFGMAGGRPVCGTQEIHQQLERGVSQLLATEDTLLYGSCYDANGGLFESLLGPEDAVISDALNHASIIDGIRLCKAQRYRYRNRDMADLEDQLRQASRARYRLIVTDGVFSMEGSFAPLAEICNLAEAYDALMMVDDSHAVGLVGASGRGTPEWFGVDGRVDILTGTFGKALGGASGGYVSGRREIVQMLRQRSRPYLFSNSLAPVIAGAALAAIELLGSSQHLLERLRKNTQFFRSRLTALGLPVRDGSHPIVPVMLGDAVLAARVAAVLLERGVLATAFSYPVVPVGEARIRTQVSAVHTIAELERAAVAFAEAHLASLDGVEA
jgi:glycine C-acetyltransferase